jgi:hypothetical protein
MNSPSTKELIKRQERGLEILEAIHSFERRLDRKKERLSGFEGTFPRLNRIYTNDIDTIEKCIIKLKNSFDTLMSWNTQS